MAMEFVGVLIQEIPPRLHGFQDVQRRLWDVLWMARLAARRGGRKIQSDLVLHDGRKSYVMLKATADPHGPDDPRPCITIMLVEED